MFNYEHEPVISNPKTPPIIFPSLPTLFGPDLDETKIDLTVSFPKPPKPTPNIGEILRKFESESKSCLHEVMTISRASANPAESDSSWEAYRRWMNYKISNLKNFGYKVSERKFRSGFVPLMEIWKLRNSHLCLPALEVNEVIQEVNEEVVRDAEANSEYQDRVMEETDAQIVISETQQVEAFISQQSVGTSYGDILDALRKTIEEIKVDNALVKERIEKQDMMFQLILSRLPLPPHQNP